VIFSKWRKLLELGSNIAGCAGDGSVNIEPTDQRENLGVPTNANRET
jgi:hypothetical protein